MYAAATVDDFAKLHTVIAPSFYAFDDGAEYSIIDSLMKAVKAAQDQGLKFVWKVTRPQVTVALRRGMDHLPERWLHPDARKCPADSHEVARIRSA